MNHNWLQILSEYISIFEKKDGPYKHIKVQKAIDKLSSDKSIDNFEKLKEAQVSDNVIEMLTEYNNTGEIKSLTLEKSKPEYKLIEIYGIGMVKARELVKKNIKSIQDLKNNTHELNSTQLKGLKYVDSTVKRIPRSEILLYKNKFEEILKKACPEGSTFEIVGSFRRGALDSGDIDVILSHKTNVNILNMFLDEAIKQNIVIETLSRGNIKSLTIAKLNVGNYDYRRVDFLYSSPKEYYFAILYFTGSKWFNTSMRQLALNKGYSLNEHCFTNKDTKEKIELNVSSERDIFQFLNMVYKEPHERIDSQSIELLDSVESSQILIDPCISYLMLYVKEGLNYLQKCTPDKISKMIKCATYKYTIGETMMSDEQFDIMKTYLESIDPSNNALHEIGCKVSKEKVTLPYFMASMDKIKPNSSPLDNWIKKYSNNYVISAKLDGISALYCNNPPYLYTRGDGKIGQNISYLIPYLKLPKLKSKCVIRGEIIISKTTFDKYKNDFANPRNLTAGIVNSTSDHSEKYSSLDFVAYELIEPSLCPLEQMTYLEKINVNVVKYKFCKNIYSNLLETILKEWKQSYNYMIDGIIISHDKIYSRENNNPKHSVAFKMMEQSDIKQTRVKDVIWNASKDGYLKPKLLIESVDLNGSNVSYVTAFNGKYVQNNNIGPDTIINIGLSGGVIPHIFEVIKSTKAKMPECSFKWSKSNIDIIVSNIENNEEVQIKKLTKFFDLLQVDGLKEGTIRQLFKSDCKTVSEILSMNKADFENVDGFAKKKSEKIYDSIQSKIKDISCVELMCASNTFGRGMGEKKINMILENFPDILTSNECNSIKINKIAELKGMSIKTAHLFVDYINDFITFLKESNLLYKIETIQKVPKNTNHPLYNKEIVLSGFRDKVFMQKLIDIGAKLSNNVTKNTFVVLVKQDEQTTKVTTAKNMNIPIQHADNFATHYNI